MATARDLNAQAARAGKPQSPWRSRLLPAHFDGRLFHVETGSVGGGRRIALHEFPKKELGYAEDMGKRAREFTVRGYVIVYPHDAPEGGEFDLLYRRDYTLARNALQTRLDQGGPGMLQLPTMWELAIAGPVVCTQYRMTEEERFGGYCVFDMTFVERGVQPFRQKPDTTGQMIAMSQAIMAAVQGAWNRASSGPAAQIARRRLPR